MYFQFLLDALFGPREVLHTMECSVCGYDEVYYLDAETRKQVGKACEGCHYVQKFDFANGKDSH